jgi:hypothetical protein
MNCKKHQSFGNNLTGGGVIARSNEYQNVGVFLKVGGGGKKVGPVASFTRYSRDGIVFALNIY